MIGFSLLGYDGVWVETVLREAASFIAAQGEFRVSEESWSIDEVSLEDTVPQWVR